MLKRFAVSVALIVFSIAKSEAGEHLLEILRCAPPDAPAVPSIYGSATLRMWPVSAIKKTLTAKEVSLRAISSDVDALSLAGSRWIDNNTIDEEGVTLLTSKKSPDTFIFVRGNEVTVFPRVMLAAPRVGLAAVKSDDIIATLFFTAGRVGAAPNDPNPLRDPQQKDALRKLLFEGAELPKKQFSEITIGGPLLGLGGQRAVKLPQIVQPYGVASFNLGNPEVEAGIIKQFGDSLADRIPVCVIRRHYGLLNYRYIVPLNKTGLFSMRGRVVTSLAVARNPSIETPSKNMLRKVQVELFEDRLGSLPLREGDLLEYTLLELVPPFHKIALSK